MSDKTLYYIAVFLGSVIGGYIPTLWGAGWLSISSLFFSTIGAIIGIIIIWNLLNK
ncbi:MAG TPA: hypothetical protein VKC54_02530 [Patescibacteria group bacterium]|nr:hypothetical protein [Patescibacteria group bacterium]